MNIGAPIQGDGAAGTIDSVRSALGQFDPRIVTVGSMSKIAWGGLRLGWIRADRALVARLLAVRPAFELGTALLEQCIAVELLQDMPALTSHVRRRLRAGRDAVIAGVGALGELAMPPVHGGLSAWLDLGAPVSTRLALAAREHGVIVPPGPRFATGGVLERRLRIPITLPPERIAEAMVRLSRAWDDVRAGTAPQTRTLPEMAVI